MYPGLFFNKGQHIWEESLLAQGLGIARTTLNPVAPAHSFTIGLSFH